MVAPGAERPLIWGNLLHLSYNMWSDREVPEWSPYVAAKPYLRFDQALWDDLVAEMARAGLNMVVIDLGDGVRYDSHPEIAVEGAWSPGKLREELAKVRAAGLEPIPKLNFSTAHDLWLAEYSRMVSTPRYYQVCADLVAEVCELFDRPRLFHLGMDEESFEHQRHYAYAVVRQHELWWHDLRLLVDSVERGGSRAWVWSDYVWRHPDDFYANMPRSVVQSNWYYGEAFDAEREPGESGPRPYESAYLACLDLDERGYDQIPTGSNYGNPVNFERFVAWARPRLSPERLLGFLQTPWTPTLPERRAHHLAAIEQVGRAASGAQAP